MEKDNHHPILNLGEFMKFFIEKCSFYSEFFKYKNRILIFPDVSEKTKIVSDSIDCKLEDKSKLLNKIKNKTFQIYSDNSKVYYAENLVIQDASLIEDCMNINVFILFFCSLIDNNLKSFWNKNINIKDMCFLGWTITNNEGDEAITDGFYPIILENNNFLEVNLNDLNKYGLLDNDKLEFYLNKNNDEVVITVQGIKQNIKWNPIGVFCDIYTFKKIKKLY